MPDTETRIILASSSPRRAELLATIGAEFEVVPSRVDEWPHSDEALADYITRLARAKAMNVAAGCRSGLVIAADTIVVVDGEVLGKPRDASDARRMLSLLSSRWHEVMTALALYDVAGQGEVTGCSTTSVRFSSLSDEEIDWYIASGEPFDKAGAYGIQGRASIFVEEIAGNYHNVMGLPLPLLHRLMKQLGYSLLR
jgi:septum formation protein